MNSVVKSIVTSYDEKNVTLSESTQIEVPPEVSLSYKIPVYEKLAPLKLRVKYESDADNPLTIFISQRKEQPTDLSCDQVYFNPKVILIYELKNRD